MEFDPTNQVTLAVGTNKGQVAIFDLRKADALLVKDHNYEEPIVSIHFHDLTNHVVSADKKIIKAWEKATVCKNCCAKTFFFTQNKLMIIIILDTNF